MRLQTRIIGLIILVFLIGGALLMVYISYQQQQYQEELINRLALILQLDIQRVQDRINNGLLLVWSSTQGGTQANTEDLQRAVNSLKEIPEVEGIERRSALEFVHVTDHQGKILASTQSSMVGQNLDATLFNQLKSLQKPRIVIDLKSQPARIYYYLPMFVFGYEDFLGGVVSALSLEPYVAFQKTIRNATIFGGLILLAGVVGFLVVSMRMMLFKPLNAITRTIHEVMEKKDFNLRVPIHRDDEIGYLAQSFNVLLDFMKSSIDNLKGTASHLQQVSEELQKYADQLMTGSLDQMKTVETTGDVVQLVRRTVSNLSEGLDTLSEFTEETTAYLRQAEVSIDQVLERTDALSVSIDRNAHAVQGITRAIQDVARTGEELSASVSEAVAAVTELNYSIKEVETSATEAATLAAQMVDNTERGEDSMESTMQGMMQIRDAFADAKTALTTLIQHTEAIEQISASIQDIASQTHLLSINASILAAQAGEQGRAFTVIVNQIQQMADQTSEYTREIEQLLNKIRLSSERAQKAMEQSDEAIENGVQRAQSARKILQTILESTHRVDDYVKKIAHATTEQARGSGQIHEAVNRVNEIAVALNDVLQSLTQASRDIERSSQELNTFAENLKMTMNSQAQGSRKMFASVARIPEMLEQLQQGLNAQLEAVRALADAMKNLQLLSETNREVVKHLNEIVEASLKESELLNRQISSFET